jgi:ectoine hydroxylase-related dioxygenase (phytanoyl-CoA dioxygenase family)
MYLSDQQLAYFKTFGFLAFPGLFRTEIEDITAAFEELWVQHGGGHAGKPHDGTRRSALVPFIDQHEYLCALLDDSRICGISSSLLGEDFNYVSSDGNYYVGDTAWHSDGWRTSGLMTIKMAFYLDPVAADSGCLRVIPGSCSTDDAFARTLQAQLRQCDEVLGVAGRDIPAYPLETQPGDLILFNQNTKHASFGGGNRRRMFTLNFSQRYPAELLPELRDAIGAHARFWLDHFYGETLLRTASPARMVHLEQVLANEGHLPELARLARERTLEPARG